MSNKEKLLFLKILYTLRKFLEDMSIVKKHSVPNCFAFKKNEGCHVLF